VNFVKANNTKSLDKRQQRYNMDKDVDGDDDFMTTQPPVAEADPDGSYEVAGGIFDDDMIEKYSDNDGKPRWRCKWCNTTFAGWNATKAIRHVNKIRGMDIKVCKVRIDAEHTKRYSCILKESERKRSRSRENHSAMDRSINSHNNITASTLESSRRSENSTISSKRIKVSNDNYDENMSPGTKKVFLQCFI
jgi:hypothetical protein